MDFTDKALKNIINPQMKHGKIPFLFIHIITRRCFRSGCHNMEVNKIIYPRTGLSGPETGRDAVRDIMMSSGATINRYVISTINSLPRVLPGTKQ